MKLAFDTKVSGHFRAEIVSPETGEVIEETGWFDNLITHKGLEAILRAPTSYWSTHGASINETYFFSYIMYALDNDDRRPQTNNSRHTANVWLGSDATPPTVDDHLGLKAPMVNTTNAYYDQWTGVRESEGYIYARMRVEFKENTIPDVVREIGVGTSAGKLFSRALFPGGGLEVPQDSILRIFYEVRFAVDMSDRTQVVDLNYEGVITPVTLTYRPAKLDGDADRSGYTASVRTRSDFTRLDFKWTAGIASLNWNGRLRAYPNPIGEKYELPVGPIENGPVTPNTVTSWANLSWDFLEFTTHYQYNYSNGANNFPEGIKAFVFHTPLSGTWQVNLDPPLPKNENNQLTFTVGTRLSRP